MYIHLIEVRKLTTLLGGTPFMRTVIYIVGRAAGVRSLPSHVAMSTCWPGSRESRSGQLRPPRTRIFEGRKQRGAATRSTVAVSAYGGVFEREPAGRGGRVFLRAPERIRI